MKPKLTPLVLAIGLMFTLIIGTTISPAKPARAATAIDPLWYSLDVTKGGNGSGRVVSSPNWIGLSIDCGLLCELNVLTGRTMVLTATTSTNSVFTGWSGACSGTDITCTLTMNSDKDVTANFTRIYTMTVAKDGNGDGTVASIPDSIDCGPTCSTTFLHNTVVTLTATPKEGSLFDKWQGDCAVDGPTCSTTVTGSRDITATFTLITYTVYVTKTGDGSGAITSEPAGIDCGATCSAVFNYNTVVTLTAVPITGSKSAEWSGNCTIDGLVCVTTVTGTREVTATFNLITTNLSVSQSVTRSAGILTFTVVATNNGPVDADGSIVSDTISTDITNPQRACEAANGASCPVTLLRVASVSTSPYAIYETLPNFPNGGIVTYTISGGVGLLTQRVMNRAEIILPTGVTDASESDNISVVITEYRVMFPIVLRSE
jgi:uncharacterized repeat protein (TIGR01451 family)/uncharacterized repeat protein (TIGR02543 family)